MRSRRHWAILLLVGMLSACGAPPPRSAPPDLDAPAPSDIRLLSIYSADRDEPYAPLMRPSGIATGPGGHFYLSDFGTGNIHVFEPDGAYLGSCESDRHGPILPLDLATHGFHLFALDGSRRRILRFQEEGAWRGVVFDLNELDQEIVEPVAMAADRDGRIAVCDAGSDRVLVLEPFLGIEQTIGEYGRLPGQLDEPRGVCFGRDGSLYVADRANSRIQQFDRTGLFLRTTQEIGGSSRDFEAPTDVAADRFGNLYVADPVLSVVVVLTPELEILRVLGDDEMAADDLRQPVRCAVSEDDLLFVVDLGRNALLIFELEFPE